MKKILSSIPKLPWWVRILPAFARNWLAFLVMTLFYGHKIYLAKKMQEECITLLQLLCGLRIAEQAYNLLIKIPPHLNDLIRKTKTDLEGFENKLIRTSESFSHEWDNFPLGAAENGLDEYFRQLTTDQELAEWAYAKWHPDFDIWVQDFLGSKPLFNDWRTVVVNDIASWIEGQAAQAYQPVWSISLEAIFELWAKETPGFPAAKRLSQETIKECMLAAIPVARPNFTAVGGSHGAVVTFHFVTGDMEWKYCNLPSEKNRAERWEVVNGGDPYLALFIQAQHNFPLKALVDSFQVAMDKLESLSSVQQQSYNLLEGLDQAAVPTTVVEDSENPDLVHKTFQWKFKPKGASKEVEQTLELAISRS